MTKTTTTKPRMALLVVAVLLLAGTSGVAAFSTSSTAPAAAAVRQPAASSRLYDGAAAEPTAAAESSEDDGEGDFFPAPDTTIGQEQQEQQQQQRPPTIYIPLSFEEMTKQVSSAMQDAMAAGKTRQTIRLLLPRSSDNENLGMMYESDAVDPFDGRSPYEDTVLSPPDETWQGGIMQLYRAASLATREILRRYSRNAPNGGVVPRLLEDRSFDESGVDGIGLWLTRGATPSDDVSCFVQPSQETVGGIERIAGQAGDRMVALVNPQWRIVDDALDSASRQGGLLGGVASFLGGKGNSLRRLEALGFESIFTLEGYVCRGGNVRLVKRFDTDWYVFAQNDAATDYIEVGSSETRPTYQDVDAMLDSKGIGLKYARDVGLAPTLE